MLTQKTNSGLSKNPNMQADEILYQLNIKPKPKQTGENGFVLSFDEKHRDKVMEKYIPHVLSPYEAMQADNRTLKIHSLQGAWLQSSFNHPASFDSIALDPDLKKAIIDDLDRFLRRKKMYKKVGKPWKRGYLLHGPPGTGKSTLVAAMAKYI
ncbi:putative P-loop containing nucleoside triphosphate hydrolase [Medicago truncatula]|uniref:Putative P-loop containing nucleoside triphosphate hydrolase n=1 Tax=Medicago truncatula TaxID=3880 RepID=A0A396HLL2_MEDTR|nr:putative P-loop containing nucleoside triphosphate hydrolase [Medicago truncatula]